MNIIRITNHGRIAPLSPKPCIDSGRTSWSSADPVSSIYTKSPEPNLNEQVTQKLQQTISKSPINKNVIIGVSSAALVLLVICAVLGGTLPSVLNKPPVETPTTTTTTDSPITTTGSGKLPGGSSREIAVTTAAPVMATTKQIK